MAEKTELWQLYANTYEDAKVPAGYSLSQFEKLLLIKVIRPEKVMRGVASFVEQTMGKFYLESPDKQMELIYKDSDVKTPIIFVLSPGADPTSSVFQFAEARDFSSNLITTSLGQGQGVVAQSMIENGLRQGHWVLLQNCHLAKSFMPQLEQILLDIQEDSSMAH